MDKLNRVAVAYIVAALFIASIAALIPVAIVVAQNNATGTNTTTTAGAQNNATGTNTTTTAGAQNNATQAQGSTPQFSANLTGDLTFPQLSRMRPELVSLQLEEMEIPCNILSMQIISIRLQMYLLTGIQWWTIC